MGDEDWIREVKGYKYVLYNKGGFPKTGKVVFLYDSSDVQHIVQFVNASTLKAVHPSKSKTSGGLIINLHEGAFSWLIDMLRNEKPIFLHWTERKETTPAIAKISTSDEPIGEEETP